MPELPEVETTRRGIAPHIEGKQIRRVVIRQHQLRWPIPKGLTRTLPGETILQVKRRAKYLLLETSKGHLLLHLGMSGSLRVLPPETPAGPHDHFDLVFDHCCLRLRDPRRFGAVLWTRHKPEAHELISHLGPEPLSETFDGDFLHQLAQRRKGAVKNFIMDGKVVVGVGNIYASESLFMSGIHPQRAANRISKARYRQLAGNIKRVLTAAIAQGGTTLKDFQREDGKPGYFAQELKVYGRNEEPCPNCGKPITQRTIGQRSSYFCSHCQR
ncbi:bifunctional DNA-formamidopyrimidine glycosylase/DNA-(apurinic or apyrimidinic site) lyase [Solemya velesiana gill symbiont]|uniref:Formamidopyrimidine-DNA glycosylase n=1 Tax=Solemya velesiana gill symbiont TaxID=1918948 RepID=A0A1T2KVC6_9GAMM|nr:bifunctional DNA-formamidopyrimidine glycosylase/DNA-(apurinic or apyrimidinic site) lyase [Solemya velesiana gill symbiont]OOZ36772.1 DNA-formamidopyrimidine glycosylase [Solemya velesiana gill symbiont]